MGGRDKKKRENIMAIVLTNGSGAYIMYTGNYCAKRTTKINDAFEFPSIAYALEGIKRAPQKTKGFFVYDTESKCVCLQPMTAEEKNFLRQGKFNLTYYSQEPVKIASKKQISLKRQYGSALYHQANGRCQLCGRRITFEDSTVDHIIPKAMGGTNDISNLQLSCYPCNQLKGSILPDTFFERVTDIFMYQMEKRYSGRFYWKILSMILRKLKE